MEEQHSDHDTSSKCHDSFLQRFLRYNPYAMNNRHPLNALLATLATVGQWLAFRRLQKSLPQPAYRQQKILQKILQQNRNTQFGQQHHFRAIKNYSDYCRSVPLHNGKTYLPYLNRCREGDYQAICHQQPLFYAMTAGSTGQYKYLPVTPAYVKEVRQSIMAFYHCLATACPETRTTPIQFIVGSAEGGLTPSGIPAGFMSGFNYKNLPAAIRNKFIIPYPVFTLEHAPDRYYAMARFLADAPELSAIGAFSPVNISNIAKYAIARLPALIADIAGGSLTLEASTLAEGFSLQANANLARQLAALANRPGQHHSEYYQAVTRLLFPGFKYAVCWQGGNMGHATQELEMYFGKKDIFEMPFSASEGIFAIPHRLNQTGGIAAITSHFLEFIPEQEIHLPDPTVLPVWKIEAGQYYYLVVTTSGGLYRYNMEDLVLVKGFSGKTPELEFIAKLQRQVSIANERLTEHDVVNAVTRTAAITQVQLGDFVLMPTHNKRYMLLLENSIADLQGFADELEKQLCLAAKGYAFEREDCLLEPVTVAQVGAGELGAYVRLIQFRTDLPTAQFKPVHICNDFEQYREFSLLAQASAAACLEAC